jgi:hypothetical protein
MWVVLGVALAFLVVAVPILVFICVRDETWGEEMAPIVRWIHGRRIKAFASAAAAGDFGQAESIVKRMMPESRQV